MAKRATRKNGTNYPAANQTRGLTDLQKRINKATGVDSNYNFNHGSAYDSAREFVKAEREAAKASGDKERKRAAYNMKRRKSLGGEGG